ncbi:MAG TPA: aminotransferase class V-fold PLP-dependent enzyme [Candidatus Paceibacterota bacterium]|nr:aminotransferase class V-fold PLP-dependent enzyme [Candidatus Paceibacterota bacterium]
MFWKKKRIYFDTAAGLAGNPSSAHTEGRQAKGLLEEARTTIARLVEVQPDDVIFTSGATESNALAIRGVIGALRKAGEQDIHVLYLPSSHASIVENVTALKEEGVTIEALPITDYRVDTEALAGLLRPTTAMVTMDAVCGETGVVWNTREVADVVRTASASGKFSPSRKGRHILLHVDASQSPHTEKITRDHFGADILTFDASKVEVMRGLGVLIAHRTIPLLPLYQGGGQERGLRSGTEAPEQAQLFARALKKATLNRDVFRASALRNRTRLIKDITRSIQQVFIQEGRVQVPSILNLSLPGRDTDYLVALLDEAGFAVSTRSACETDSETGSRAVYALTGDSEKAQATIRISWGPAARPGDFTRFARAFIRAVAFIDSSGRR